MMLGWPTGGAAHGGVLCRRVAMGLCARVAGSGVFLSGDGHLPSAPWVTGCLLFSSRMSVASSKVNKRF